MLDGSPVAFTMQTNFKYLYKREETVGMRGGMSVIRGLGQLKHGFNYHHSDETDQRINADFKEM